MTAEQRRLDNESRSHWKRSGPYLSERALGTVREDYRSRIARAVQLAPVEMV